MRRDDVDEVCAMMGSVDKDRVPSSTRIWRAERAKNEQFPLFYPLPLGGAAAGRRPVLHSGTIVGCGTAIYGRPTVAPCRARPGEMLKLLLYLDLLMEDFVPFLSPLSSFQFADVVYGSRFIGGKPHRILFFWHSLGNKMLTFMSNVTTNLNLTDMETCYKMFRTEMVQGLTLKEKRFGFEPEVTAKIERVEGARIYEVGISYYGRTFAEGKKIGWKDGFRAIYCILKYGLFK